MNLIHYGLGPIGLRILGLALRAPSMTVAAAVDLDPQKAGRDVGDLLGVPEVGVRVAATLQELPTDLPRPSGAVALHATGSRLEKVWPQLRDILDAGFSVVSTCEELSYPWHRYPQLAREIDGYARQRGLTVLGTGVNPGFVMDSLALCLTAVVGEVRQVWVRRAVDVATRRLPLQRKVGVGMDPEVFRQLAAAGEIGHVGLEESARLVAHGLGWDIGKVTNTIEPTIADSPGQVSLGDLAPGDVDGLWQRCVARATDGRSVELDLTMRVGVASLDEIIVSGDEERRLVVPEGLPGDTATAAIAVNSARRIPEMAPGLATMLTAGLPRCG